MSKVQELGDQSTGAGSGAGEAIKRDKTDTMIVNHCCVFGRLLLGVILLHYLLLSILYSTLNIDTDFIKVLIKV